MPEFQKSVKLPGKTEELNSPAIGKGEGDKKVPDLAGELTSAQIEPVIRFLQTWNISAPADSGMINDQ